MLNSTKIFTSLLAIFIVLLTPATPAQLDVLMVDSGGDGWFNTDIQIIQNNNVIGFFGYQFTNGLFYSPISFNVDEGAYIQIVAFSAQLFTDEVGFVLKDAAGNVLFQRDPGVAFGADERFASICIGDCFPKVNIAIERTRAGSGEWDGNVIGIMQNNAIISKFGFNDMEIRRTIPVQKNKLVQIMVSNLGFNTNEVGFTVFDPNGGTIYNRAGSAQFFADTNFVVLCPDVGCQTSKYVGYFVVMSDVGGDGWNGNVIGFRQNGMIVDTFGADFMDGSSTDPVVIYVRKNVMVEIVVYKLGTKTNQIGFIVKTPAQQVLYERTSGKDFYAGTVFGMICPIGGCQNSVNMEVIMFDSAGNGWEGNTLAFRQGSSEIGVFGGGFTSGAMASSVFITVPGTEPTQIVPSNLAFNVNEMGFIVKDDKKRIIHEHKFGSVFNTDHVFKTFCPRSCTTLMKLQIMMGDSGGDGWNGNVLGLKQNGVILDSFGADFTSGSSSGPVYIYADKNTAIQVISIKEGQKTSEITFTIKNQNSETISQRTPGTQFPGTIIQYFCPSTCASLPFSTLKITMTDSKGDGWNGNSFVLRQNGIVMGTFGRSFITGAVKGPVSVIVEEGYALEVLVGDVGTKSNQIGFVIKTADGTILKQKIAGATLAASNLYTIFCPINTCLDMMRLQIRMTDTGANGWSYNVIGVKQRGALVGVFGSTFTTGSSAGPIYINIFSGLRTQIAVSTLGLKTNEIGFVVKDPSGNIIYERKSGTTFTYTSVFTYFCPARCSNSETLTISMTDAGQDGWDGNILAIKQDDRVVNTFGADFASGASSGPLTVTVQGDKEFMVMVSQFGTKTEQIGLTITASNGTMIYQRKPGVEFYEGTILSKLCLFDSCPSTNYLTLGVTMSDSASDGQNGNILAVKQNNAIIDTFGKTFLTGASDFVYITVQGDIETKIVFTQFGGKVNEMGFIVRAPNGTIIYRKYAGTTYVSNKIFATFCPIADCPSNSNVDYSVTTTDSKGNGWQGTILAFKQNGAVVGTFTLSQGAQGGPTTVTLTKFITTSIVVNSLGSNSHQIGFKIVNAYGETVFQRVAGARVYYSTALGSFCPECVNLSPVGTPTASGNPMVEESSYQIQDQNLNEVPTETGSQGYMIATYVLVSLLLLVSVILVSYFLKQKMSPAKPSEAEKPLQLVEVIESSQNIQKCQTIA